MQPVPKQEVCMGAAIRKEEFYRMSETGKRIYTTADIEALPEGVRAELLEGEMYMMAPPVTIHQMILRVKVYLQF